MNTPVHPSIDVASIASRTGFPVDAVESMRRSIERGGGRMAQFDHRAFGGPGQWMSGGMTMIGDPFDDALKRRVAHLCEVLADALVVAGDRSSIRLDAVDVPPAADAWYPAAFGAPSSSGSQDRMRYAWFAEARRLAIDDGTAVTLYDTADHAIGGVAQQQGSRGTIAFTSQHGTVDLARLRVVDGPGSSAPVAAVDPFAALERLAALHARGIVGDDEFAAKRIELLERI